MLFMDFVAFLISENPPKTEITTIQETFVFVVKISEDDPDLFSSD